jgi:urea carboxylase
MKTRYSYGGDEHIFAECGEEMSLEAFFKSLSVTTAIKKAKIKGVTEICPANAGFQVKYDPDKIKPTAMLSEIKKIEAQAGKGKSETAMAHREFRRIGARPQIFRRLDLPLAFHHLIEERQPRNEPHHGHKPRRTRMGFHEAIDAIEVVDPRGVFNVSGLRILMPITELHQRLIVKWKPIDRAEYDETAAAVEKGKFSPRMKDVTFSLAEFQKDIDGYNKKLMGALYGK